MAYTSPIWLIFHSAISDHRAGSGEQMLTIAASTTIELWRDTKSEEIQINNTLPSGLGGVTKEGMKQDQVRMQHPRACEHNKFFAFKLINNSQDSLFVPYCASIIAHIV